MNAQGGGQPPGISNPGASAPAGGQQPGTRTRFRDRRPWRWIARGYAAWVHKYTRDEPPDDAEDPVTEPWRRKWPTPLRIFADILLPLPLDPPWSFPQSVDQLLGQLQAADDSLVDELLSDAEKLFAEADANVKSAEQRASTLQGSVAIAATVALVGGGLVLDPTKIHGHHWRIAFAVGLVALVTLLALTALRATGASVRLGYFTTISDEKILKRAGMKTVAMAKTHRTAYLLHGYGRNAEQVQVKVAYLRKAAFWFRGAVAVLVILMAMVCSYVIDTRGQAGQTTSAAPSRPSTVITIPSVKQFPPVVLP